MHYLHASHLLGEGTLLLAVFDLARIEDLLEQGRLPDPLVDADCRGGEQQNEAVEVSRVDYLFDRLGRRRRVQGRLVKLSLRAVDVLDNRAVVLTHGDGEACNPLILFW